MLADIKGRIWIFFWGGNSLSHGSASSTALVVSRPDKRGEQAGTQHSRYWKSSDKPVL